MSPANDPAVSSRQSRRTSGPRLGDWIRPSWPPHALLLRDDALWHAGTAKAPHLPSVRCTDFAAWCAEHHDAACDLLVSGTMVHDLVCDPALPVGSDGALLEHARRVFGHYHGDSAGEWPLAAWSARGQRGVSALHGVDVEGLLATARSHGVRIHTLQPWWSRALALALRRLPALRKTAQAWLLIVEGSFVSALCLRHGRCCDLRTQWLADRCPTVLEAFAAQLRSEAGPHAELQPMLALGFGLAPGVPSGIGVLGTLDERGPAAHWLLERELQS